MATSRQVCYAELSGVVCFGYISACKLHCDWLFHESTMAVAAPGMHVVRQTE